MRQLEDPEVGAWIAKAEKDLRMAHLALSADRPMWDQACFHAHQCVEKALKAILVASDSDVPRTHDLVFLLNRALVSVPDARRFLGATAELAHYGVAPRYPTFLAEETEMEARDAVEHADAILAFATRALQQH